MTPQGDIMARDDWMQDHAAKRTELQAACPHPELGVTGEGEQSRYRCGACQWEGSSYELVAGDALRAQQVGIQPAAPLSSNGGVHHAL
jgi:hypothetical protein